MQSAPKQTKRSEDFRHTESWACNRLQIKKSNITVLLTTSFFLLWVIQKTRNFTWASKKLQTSPEVTVRFKNLFNCKILKAFQSLLIRSMCCTMYYFCYIQIILILYICRYVHLYIYIYLHTHRLILNPKLFSWIPFH